MLQKCILKKMWTNKQPEWTHLFELLFLPWILRRFLKKPRDRRVLEWWIQIYPWTSSIWPRFLSNSWATLPTNTTNDDHCRHYSKLCTCTVKTNRQQWLHQSTESTERHTWMHVLQNSWRIFKWCSTKNHCKTKHR